MMRYIACQALGLFLFLIQPGLNRSAGAAELSEYTGRPACGPASVVVLLSLSNHDASISSVNRAFEQIAGENPRSEADARDMIVVLKSFGIQAEVQRWPRLPMFLSELPAPCIVHTQSSVDTEGHFSVLTGVRDGNVILFTCPVLRKTISMRFRLLIS